MRGYKHADTERYKYYRDTILFPFIKKLRVEYDNFNNGVSNLPIPDDLTVSSWCDGDLEQIRSIVNDLEEYERNKVIGNKHSASRSGTEQGSDLTKTFMLLKRMQK